MSMERGYTMVRDFWFKNQSGEIFDLMGHETDFLNSPAGLGFRINASLSEIGNRLKVDEKKPDFQEVAGEMMFKDYQDYQSFTEFVTSAKTLYLYYKIPAKISTAYIECIITVVEKSEKDYQTSYLTCPITVKPLTLWSVQQTKVFSFGDNGGGGDYDKLPYNLPFILGNNSGDGNAKTNQLEIINKGGVETPMVIKFKGSAINPAWYLNKNNAFNSGSLSLIINPNQEVIIDSTDGAMMTYSNNVILDEYLAIDKKNYLKLQPGTNQLFLTNILEGEVSYIDYYYTI